MRCYKKIDQGSARKVKLHSPPRTKNSTGVRAFSSGRAGRQVFGCPFLSPSRDGSWSSTGASRSSDCLAAASDGHARALRLWESTALDVCHAVGATIRPSGAQHAHGAAAAVGGEAEGGARDSLPRGTKRCAIVAD